MASLTKQAPLNIENAKVKNLMGLERLQTAKGLDIVDFATNFSSQMDKMTRILSDLSERVSRLEVSSATPVAASGPVVDDLKARIEKFERMLDSDELRGPRGLVGPAGPAGPKGKVEMLQDIKDVDVSGLQDGCVLVRRGATWRAEVLSEE
jgi:hypothetical protein